MKKPLIVVALMAIAFGSWFVFWRDNDVSAPNNNIPQGVNTAPFDRMQHSIDDSASIWVVVNKKRPLAPSTYKPVGLIVPNVPLQDAKESEEMKLRPETARALEALVAAAKDEAGYKLMLASGYRGYVFQKNLYERYVREEGQASADTQSARPGYSEHQTGLAADVAVAGGRCVVEVCFADMPEGKWLAKNAHRFGFVIRYKKDKTAVTGYGYEPWHLRYVGNALATEIFTRGTTLEEFFGLPSASSYQ